MEKTMQKKEQENLQAPPDNSLRVAYRTLDLALQQAMARGMFTDWRNLDACRLALREFEKAILEVEQARAQKSN